MSAVPQADPQGAAEELCRQRGLKFSGLLGNGAFKKAYLAVAASGDSFAVKLAQMSGPVERLLRETAALQNCVHNNISRLVDAFPFQYAGFNYWVVVEEYLAGGTLERQLTFGVLSPADVRTLGITMAQVLAYLYPMRLVHRDIKPANIMFRADRTPVLTDFGIVRMLDEPTLTHGFFPQGPGTPAYAAPEQLNNEKAMIDWRTDQFDLAIVLAECLTGHHPYLVPGRSIQDAIVAIAAKQTMPAASAATLTGLGFGCLVQALKPWPIARFRKPDQLIHALQQI